MERFPECGDRLFRSLTALRRPGIVVGIVPATFVQTPISGVEREALDAAMAAGSQIGGHSKTHDTNRQCDTLSRAHPRYISDSIVSVFQWRMR